MKTLAERKVERENKKQAEKFNDIVSNTNIVIETNIKEDNTLSYHLIIGVIIGMIIIALCYFRVVPYVVAYFAMILFAIAFCVSGVYIILKKRYYE